MTTKDHLLGLLNQFIPVVLGVYVGILASNWNDKRVQKAEQKEFIENLKQEIGANKAELEKAVAYQKEILQAARKVRQDLDREVLESEFWNAGHFKLIPGWQGLNIPRLENSVHTSGIMINAMAGMEFRNINSISRTYNHQEDYKRYAQRLIFDNLTQLENQVRTVEVFNKLEVWQDVIYMGEELVEQYQQTLEQLETK